MKKNNRIVKAWLSIISIILIGVIGLVIKIGLNKISNSDEILSKNESNYDVENSFISDLSMSGRIVLENNVPNLVTDKKYDLQIESVTYESVNQFSMIYDTINKYAEAQVILCGESIWVDNEQIFIEPQFFITEEDICVPTPFCVLHYPVEWADYLKITKESVNDKYIVKFSAIEEKEEIDLFSIIFFANEGEGIGKIIDNNDGVISVSILMEEINSEAFSNLQDDYIYGMLDALNYIIEKLNEENNFSSEI